MLYQSKKWRFRLMINGLRLVINALSFDCQVGNWGVDKLGIGELIS